MEITFDLLSGFESISLDKMNKVKLLDRIDKKFMFHIDHLYNVLTFAKNDYYILEIAGKLSARYETTYFDTSNFDMYTRHHNGKLNRHKVRFRSYVDSNLHFFEVKFKSNKGRTIKNRIKMPDNQRSIAGGTALLLEQKTIYKASELLPALQVNYNRITLVSKNMTERITIDFGLNYVSGEKYIDLPSLIIVEVKQNQSESSSFISIMQQERIKPVSISKYCLGIASTVDNVKLNNFKSKLRYVNQLFSSNA